MLPLKPPGEDCYLLLPATGIVTRGVACGWCKECRPAGPDLVQRSVRKHWPEFSGKGRKVGEDGVLIKEEVTGWKYPKAKRAYGGKGE